MPVFRVCNGGMCMCVCVCVCVCVMNRHGLRSLLIDRVSPLMTLATGTAFYRLGPYVAHTLAMLGLDSSSALFPVAFYTATDVLHTLPTVPLRNSAIHRVLEEKPIEGVCLRLRSGPESVSRWVCVHAPFAHIQKLCCHVTKEAQDEPMMATHTHTHTQHSNG